MDIVAIPPERTLPTTTLEEEHRNIEIALAILQRMARKLTSGASLASGDARALLAFFRRYADEIHQMKEEELLFETLERAGLCREGGPIGVMLHEHEEGRQLLGEMEAALEAGLQGSEGERFAKTAQHFVTLNREHILKEDGVLYLMGGRILSADDRRELERRFETRATRGAAEASTQLEILRRLQLSYAE